MTINTTKRDSDLSDCFRKEMKLLYTLHNYVFVITGTDNQDRSIPTLHVYLIVLLSNCRYHNPS